MATKAQAVGPAVKQILDKLDRVKAASGGGWMARCPAHEDRRPSLKIDPGDDGRVLMYCHAGCTTEAICAALGITARELFELQPPTGAAATGRVCVREYVYRDPATGAPIARKLRFEPKSFSLERWDGTKWIPGLDGLNLPLYRQREIEHEPWIVLTEGEKDADAGATVALPTATSGGVNSFREYHAERLRGRCVLIVADADDPGRQHAQKVAARAPRQGREREGLRDSGIERPCGSHREGRAGR